MLVPPIVHQKEDANPQYHQWLHDWTNKLCVTIANSNGLSGHPCRMNLVGKTFGVTPPLSIT